MCQKATDVLTAYIRFDERRGGESYRPGDRSGRSPSRGYESRRRSPPRNRSRPRADTWVPSDRGYGRPRDRSPPSYRHRSRTPPSQARGSAIGHGPYSRRRSPVRRTSPRRDDRFRSPPLSWRSRSPHSENRSRDVSRGRCSPKRAWGDMPGRTSPTAPGGFRKELPGDSNRDRPPHLTRQISPTHISPTEANAVSRRVSPVLGPGQRSSASRLSRSRSPLRHSPPRRPSGTPSRSPHRNLNYAQEPTTLERPQGTPDHPRDNNLIQRSGAGRFSGNVPTQPRNSNVNPTPPSGPSQGLRAVPSHARGSYNMSLLSAPTRPRRTPGPREGSWAGPPMARRGPSITTSHSAPSGPRASFASPLLVEGNYRNHSPRQNSVVSTTSSPAPRAPNHLAGLVALIPGGKAFPPALDTVLEKRLNQLDADKERLLEQMAETQRRKRAGLRDWDRLDRESSICALKSELAEGHLQRMADESVGGGILF